MTMFSRVTLNFKLFSAVQVAAADQTLVSRLRDSGKGKNEKANS
jgi:hypothetical protein